MIKKHIQIVLLILTTSMLSAQLRLGADLGGKLGGTVEGEDMGSIGMAMGFSLAYDHMLTDMFGAGLEYQLGRGSDAEDDESEIGFTTVYGVVNYSINEKMAAKLRLGYSISATLGSEADEIAKPKGGLMYGLGVAYGINDNLGVDVGYYNNAMTWEASVWGESFKAEYNYTRLQAGLTYSF